MSKSVDILYLHAYRLPSKLQTKKVVKKVQPICKSIWIEFSILSTEEKEWPTFGQMVVLDNIMLQVCVLDLPIHKPWAYVICLCTFSHAHTTEHLIHVPQICFWSNSLFLLFLNA